MLLSSGLPYEHFARGVHSLSSYHTPNQATHRPSCLHACHLTREQVPKVLKTPVTGLIGESSNEHLAMGCSRGG